MADDFQIENLDLDSENEEHQERQKPLLITPVPLSSDDLSKRYANVTYFDVAAIPTLFDDTGEGGKLSALVYLNGKMILLEDNTGEETNE